MSWRDELIDRLSASPCCGYGASDGFATEPSAFAALALLTEGRRDGAEQVASWLAEIQNPDGSVGVRASETKPCWPTSLAVLVWTAMQSIDASLPYLHAVDRAITWILHDQSRIQTERASKLGHDPSIAAWPWVEGTHGWVEPTALHVLALRAVGRSTHPRVRDAVQMLLDRQLRQGGWNYGNTTVLGNELRPHVQPTGIALLALASDPAAAVRVHRSLDRLRRELTPKTATTSLCWALIALAAYRQTPGEAIRLLEAAYHRTMQRDQSPLKLALIALAAQQDQSFLVRLPSPRRTTESELS